jgi:hypothetical protein
MAKIGWKKARYGAYQYGPYIIERTSNPNALRQWYVRGGTAEFSEALRRLGAFNGGFFQLSRAKTAVAEAHGEVGAPPAQLSRSARDMTLKARVNALVGRGKK